MNSPRAFDPRRLDVAAFAQARGTLQGEWPVAAMPRLLQYAVAPSDGGTAPSVAWSVRGSSKAVTGGEDELRLHLQARTVLQLACQRCLQPMTVELDIRPQLRFVRGEAEAEALDEASDDEDVLALTPALDLQPLIEDELILALPLVPRHASCPQPLPMSAGEDSLAGGGKTEGAFAGLASLLRDGGSGGRGGSNG
jgi:uncharacterized protein